MWYQTRPANVIDKDQGREEAPALRVVVVSAPLLHDLCLDCVVISSWINSARRHRSCGVLAVSDRAENCGTHPPPPPPFLPSTAPFVSALILQKAADRLKPALFEREKKQRCVFTLRMNIGGCTRNPISFPLLHRMFRGVSARVWPPSTSPVPNWLVPFHEHVPQRLKHQTQLLLADFSSFLS